MRCTIQTSIRLRASLLAAYFATGAAAENPLSSTFTYQGTLQLEGSPVNDMADFEFTLWDDVGPIGSTASIDNIAVVDGIFTVELDFGVEAFNGEARWLEIAVRSPAGAGDYTTLSPQQPITATPYALQTRGLFVDDDGNVGVGTTTPSDNLEVVGNVKASGVLQSGDGITIDGDSIEKTITSSGSLQFIVDNQHAFELISDGESPVLIGGHWSNSVTDGATGATISGGGSAVAENIVTDRWGTIGGGFGNQAGDGDGNPLGSMWATVGGGANNTAGSLMSTVGGGTDNTASSNHATVGGGTGNSAGGAYSTVGGGIENTVTGQSATVPGGRENHAGGDYSFAAGRRARAVEQGAFVWADSTDEDFTATAPDQFLIRAANGVGIGTSSPAEALHVSAGNIRADRGDSQNSQVRTLTLGGARTIDFDFARIDFENIDEDDGAVDYVAARIAAFNSGESDDGDLRFSTSSDAVLTEHMRISHEGKVGIWTDSPESALHVSGGNVQVDRGTAISGLTRSLTLGGARESNFDFARIDFRNYDNNSGATDYVAATVAAGNAGLSDDGDLRFSTASDTVLTEHMRITAAGNVGIKTASPSAALDVVGNAEINGSLDMMGNTIGGVASPSAGDDVANKDYVDTAVDGCCGVVVVKDDGFEDASITCPDGMVIIACGTGEVTSTKIRAVATMQGVDDIGGDVCEWSCFGDTTCSVHNNEDDVAIAALCGCAE